MTNQKRLRNYAKSDGKHVAAYKFPSGTKIYRVTPAQRRRLVKKGNH